MKSLEVDERHDLADMLSHDGFKSLLKLIEDIKAHNQAHLLSQTLNPETERAVVLEMARVEGSTRALRQLVDQLAKIKKI